MRVAFFEDRVAVGLGPIAAMRPVFELLCGRFSVRERALRTLGATEWGALVRPLLAESYREAHPEARINDLHWLGAAPTLLLNGRWIPRRADLEQIASEWNPAVAALVGGTLAWLVLDPAEASLLTSTAWEDMLLRIARSRLAVNIGGTVVERPWHLVDQNARQLVEDFAIGANDFFSHDLHASVAVLGPADSVRVDPAARIDPFVVLDARQGPITIDAGAVVGSFTQIEGPAHIGRASQLFRAHVRTGTTIGPVCRVGGEIETAIFHSHVNKYHTGFIGHSYVGPWVNLGALTTGSDLKNDYSAVSVPLAGEPIPSGSTKVGCFIGDHTKTALGSLFNTGSSIGAFCMILPDGRLLPKHIPSFTRIWNGELAEVPDLNESIRTARISMDRRNMEFTPALERLARALFDNSTDERLTAIHHAAAKKLTRHA